MNRKKITGIFLLSFWYCMVQAQTIGGSSAYNFTKLPSSPMLTALGGANVSYNPSDVGLTANNPSLLRPELSSHLALSFNSFLAGAKTYSLTGAYERPSLQTIFGAHVYYVDYGNIPQTDAAGNVSGNFRPVDFVLQFSAARLYLEKWHYGASIKYIGSSYQQYKSGAIAMDFGLHYEDTAHYFSAGFTAKNMGVQVKTYAGDAEDLPFDLQIGITKKLAKAPLGFSLTGQRLHQFDILYNDTSFNNDNDLHPSKNFVNKALLHLVLASHLYLGKNLEANIGFNFLRRNDLNIGTGGNGLNGFSFGLRAKFQKLQFAYGLSNYQRNIAYHQFGLTLIMNKLVGTGK